MKARHVALAVALLLVGCKDKGRCLETDTWMYVQPGICTTAGGITTCTPTMAIPMTDCKRWEFPEGRPTDEQR